MENLDAQRIDRTSPQPVRRRPRRRVRKIGELRLPIAIPYRPRARLYLFPDGRLLWLVRLWEHDRAVAHLVRPETLTSYARVNALWTTLAEIDTLHRRGAEEARRAVR
ncbi:MAG: hypothetical protein WB873_10110 [Thermoplasmata archaeon]